MQSPALRHRTRTRMGAAAAVALLATTLVSCSSSKKSTSTNSTTNKGPVAANINVAISNALPSLDPVLTDQALQVFDSVFDHLVTTSADGKLTPDLATSWTPSDGAKTWTFTLRDAKFSDGTPVTPNDVVYSFLTVRDNPKAAASGDISNIKTLVATGTNQVVFTLASPFSSWPIQTRGISIVPEAAYKSLGANGFATKPIGSGPYKVVSFTRDVSVKLTTNPFYWGAKPTFTNVTVESILDQSARSTALQSGSVALTPLLAQQVSSVKNNSSINVSSRQGNLAVYLGFNTTAPEVNNAKFRKAIDYAIDRATLTKTLLQGLGVPDGQMVSPATFGYDPAIQPTPYDQNMAKTLVGESGYTGQTITFQWPTDFYIPFENEIAQAIQGELKQVGINIKLVGSSTDTFVSDWFAKKFKGIYMFSWNPSSLDADAVLGTSFNVKQVSYFDDPQINTLISQEGQEADPAKRAALISQIWKINQENAYYAPLFYTDYSVGMTKSKVSYTTRADGLIHVQDLHQP